MELISKVDDRSLRSFLEGAEGTIVVDFFTDWCVACRAMVPALTDLARARNVAVLKVNVEDSPGLADEFHVRSIPTVVRIESGREIARSVGFANSKKLARRLGFRRR